MPSCSRSAAVVAVPQKQLAAVKEAKKQQLTYWEERTLQPSRQQRWYQVDPLVLVHAHTRKDALPHRTAPPPLTSVTLMSSHTTTTK